MKQVLIGSGGALVARMPAPVAMSGCVLIRVKYSLISTGTEIAALRPISSSISGAAPIEQVTELSSKARHYLGKAAKNPRKAAEFAVKIITSYTERKFETLGSATGYQGRSTRLRTKIKWYKQAANKFSQKMGQLSITTDDSAAKYQAISQKIDVSKLQSVGLVLEGSLTEAPVTLGLIDSKTQKWLNLITLEPGYIDDEYVFDLPESCEKATVVIANTTSNQPAQITINTAEISAFEKSHGTSNASEFGHQGWNVGYSAAGEIIAVGEGVRDLAVGEIVACAGVGQANHAEYVAVKRNLVARVPKNCPIKVAATTTVGAIAMQGVRRANVRLGEISCVIGLGLIGMITVQLLKASGCQVVGIDLDEERVKKAKEIGIDAAGSSLRELQSSIRDLTNGKGVDHTLITAASKSNSIINMAMDNTRRKGVVVIVGDVGLKPERSSFYQKEIDLLMSTSYGPGRYDTAYEDHGHDYPYAYVRWTENRNMQSYMELQAKNKIDIETLIEHIVEIDNAPEIYEDLASSKKSLPLAVLLEYPDLNEKTKLEESIHKISLRGHVKPIEGKIKYALVGAGAFGTSMLVPQMDKNNDLFSLKAVVSRDQVRGSNFARSRRIKSVMTDFKEILSDDGIDLVVIATRHAEHASQSIAALIAGKSVFVEKPLALSWEDMDKIFDAYEKVTHTPFLMIGYNRRFAPATQLLQKKLKDRKSPVIINYRLNAGYVPNDHWIQQNDGGGRNIGEACHMYDFFRFFSASAVKSIKASSIDPGQLPFKRNDNFVAVITYEDGSVGSLTYTSLGPKKGMPKERIEVFCDGESYVIDDFLSLKQCSTGEILWQSRYADKGHSEQMRLTGLAIVNGVEAPIPFNEILETTAVSLHIEELLFCD